MIWHIFRKDLRLTWKLALATAVLQWISIAVLVKLGAVSSGGPMTQLRTISRMAALLATCLVIVTVVHHDAVPGAEKDWLVRPIRRRDLLLAKGLFVLLALQLPMLMGCVAEGLAVGLGFGESFLAALWQGAMMALGFFVPALAVAAMTTSIVEGAVLVVACVFTTAGLTALASSFGWSLGHGPPSMDWIDVASLTLGMCLAGAIALGIQYSARHTIRARFASGLVFTLGAAGVLLPWQSAFALQQRIAAASGAAANVRLAFDPALGRIPYPSGSRNAVFLPIRAKGLSAGMMVISDRVEVHLTAADGSVRNLTPMQFDTFDSDHAWQSLESIGATLPITRNEPVRVAVDYWLTLIKETGAYSIPQTGGDIGIPSFGRCTTKLTAGGEQGLFSCAKAGPSTGCISLTMISLNFKGNQMCSSYAPSFLWVPDWDEITRLQRGFMSVSGATGVARTYAILDHFVRHVEIPSVRLADWEDIANGK